MKADLKKRLIKIQRDLYELQADHTQWMEDHDSDWEYTPSGERAQEESMDMDTIQEYLQGITKVDMEMEY